MFIITFHRELIINTIPYQQHQKLCYFLFNKIALTLKANKTFIRKKILKYERDSNFIECLKSYA
jgi:hypothetical protein